MKKSHFLLFLALTLSLATFAQQRPISRLAVNVTVDEEPFCRSRSHCVAVSRVPGNPRLFTVEFFGRDSVLTDRLTAYSTRSRRITAKNIEDLLNDGSIVMHGDYWRYSQKGVLERRSYFQNGKRDSLNYIFLPGDGNYIVTRYSEGVKDGVEQEFHNRRLLTEIRYHNGIPDERRIIFKDNRVRGVILYDTLGLKVDATEYYDNDFIKRIERYELDTVQFAKDSVYREMLVSVEHFELDGTPTILDDFVVERAPVFHSDADSLTRYLLTNVQFPFYARMIDLEGIVRVSVEIDENGYVVDAEALPTTNLEFSHEAVRVIKNMPRWEKAGIRYWEPARLRTIVSVPFFINYRLTPPASPEDYWKKTEEKKPENESESEILIEEETAVVEEEQSENQEENETVTEEVR